MAPRKTLNLLLFVLPLLTGCTALSGKEPATGPAPGDILLSPSGRLVTFDKLMRGLRRDRVVFIGESHDNENHHAFQARTVEAMYAQDPRLLIGMEMFQRPFQGALDRFIAGETSEAQLLRESEYFTRWRWDWRYYRDILLFAREKKIPVIALNSPKEANRRVSQGGGLKALTPEDKRWVAEEIDLSIEAHRKFVMAVFEVHPVAGFDKEAFYASQCLWEDTMAESVARALDARPGHRMAVIVGSGHVRQRFGVPVRAERRGARPYSVLVGMDLAPAYEPPDLGELLAEDYGDALYFTEAGSGAPSPKVGVYFAGESLAVEKLVPGGIAELAGVAVGDRLISLNGEEITDLVGLKIALAFLTERMGTLTVARDGKEMTFSFDTAWARP